LKERGFIFGGRDGVFIVVILLIGMAALLSIFGPLPRSTEEESEIVMSGVGFSVEESPDVDFNSKVTITINFLNSSTGDGVSLFVLDQENYDLFVEALEAGNGTDILYEEGALEIITRKYCSGDSSLNFSFQEDGSYYLVMVNHRGYEHFILTQEQEWSYGFGVCFAVSLVPFFIAGLLAKAVFQMRKPIPHREKPNVKDNEM